VILNTHYEQIVELIMKSSYEAELDYLLVNPRRAKKNAKRIKAIRAILAADETITQCRRFSFSNKDAILVDQQRASR
jgi:hypothetical protein